MRQVMKIILLASVLAWGLFQSAFAFTPAGPVGNGGDSWQIQSMGFNPLGTPNPAGFGDPFTTGPKNIGEGYRRNTPVMYYTFSQNFVDYFGSNGTNAVAGAFNILNGLTNVDNYSSSLSEFPLQSSALNYQAQALNVYDVKSLTLTSLMMHLGLDDAVRYTWTLHARFHVGTIPCPVGEEYLVTERNLGISPTPLNQVQYTPYVNNSLYDYFIFEDCGTGPDLPVEGMAIPVPDQSLNNYAPVASGTGFGFLVPGQFYTGLTRDDMAGLRYLLQAANVNVESPAAGSLLQSNILGQITTLTTSNLTTLVLASQTNPPAILTNEFPGLVVSSSSNYLVVVATPNIVAYFTNYPGSAAGSPPFLFIATNGYTYSAVTEFADTFANVVTNSYSSNTVVNLQTFSVGRGPTGSAAGSVVTNITDTKEVLTNVPSGEYYIIPPDSCGYSILNPQPAGFPFANTVTTSNLVLTATNTLGGTNAAFAFNQSIVSTFTNHTFAVEPITCSNVPPAAENYEGIEQMQFVHVDWTEYDTIAGQFYTPITNNYTMSMVVKTNNTTTVVIQNFQRVLTTPDFLISAADLTTPGGVENLFSSTDPNWNESNVLPELAGPGTIDPGAEITFNTSGVIVANAWPAISGPENSEAGAAALYGSFDGTTNPPVLYPNGTSISNIESQVFIQFSPLTLPVANNGVPYSVTFSVVGGQSPYTWSVATGSSLPTGLTLSSNGLLTGTITQALGGAYDFVIQMTDSANHVVQRNYTLTIN
jgi:hypothetical protein